MMEVNKLDIAHLRRDDGPKSDGVPHAVIDHPGSPPVFEEAPATTCNAHRLERLDLIRIQPYLGPQSGPSKATPPTIRDISLR